MRRTVILLVALLLGGCTQQQPAPSPSTTTLHPAPVHAPVAWPVQAMQPVKDDLLLYNQLYRSGHVAAVSCALPTARLDNQRAMIRYATAFVACLDGAWAPIVTRAGFDFVRPSAVYSSPPGTKTACGAMEKDVYGMYCATNRGIYFNWPTYIVEGTFSQQDAEEWVQWLIAHEFGHHVQALTGILDQYDERYEAATTDAARQAEEHRSEMQAHCFAAAFFGANRDTFRIRGTRLDYYGHPGYDRRAPDMKNFDRWLRQAFEARGPGGCNTWVAPANSVTGV